MSVWLLILFAVQAGQIQGAALVGTFIYEEACIVARQHLATAGHNVRHSRCVKVSLGEEV